jgi:hypothetical protein
MILKDYCTVCGCKYKKRKFCPRTHLKRDCALSTYLIPNSQIDRHRDDFNQFLLCPYRDEIMEEGRGNTD